METVDHVSHTPGTSAPMTEGRLPRRDAVFDVIRWAMLALWVVVMTIAATVGSHSSELRELESSLDAGVVTSVKITPGMPPGAEGITMQTLFWRAGVLNHHADVVMTTPGDHSGDESVYADDATTVRSGYDIAGQIAATHPDVVIQRIPERMSYAEVYGFQVPSWLFAFAVIGAAGTLMVLVSGPEPWRATRWAWFWIISIPIGPPLFLILAGPTPPLRSPREHHRRLTGGWAFLMALLLPSLLSN